MNRGLVIVAFLGCVLIAIALLIAGWQLSSSRKFKLRVSGDKQYRQLAEEYQRLAEMAITAQEHTDLKLSDVTTRINQVRDQLESVQRILADVE